MELARETGRAWVCAQAQGSGFKSRAAPATVTGEGCPTMPPGDAGKAGQTADPGARRPVPLAVVRLRAGCTAGQWSVRLPSWRRASCH